MRKLSENEKELYQWIDEVVHYIWDPIGISDCPGARDEYSAYIPELFRLAKENGSEDKIVEYLNHVQFEMIGLNSDIKKCKEVASIITDWSEHLSFIGFQ